MVITYQCDGAKSCSRCVNRGIPCVYVVRSPRVRAPKKIPPPVAEATPSKVTLSSCLTSEPLVHRPYSTPSSAVGRPAMARSRRRSSDTALGLDRRGSIRRESELRRGHPAKVDNVGPSSSRAELVGWEGEYPSASPSRRLSRAEPHSESPHEVLTPLLASGQPWGAPAPYDYSPGQSFSVTYSRQQQPYPQTYAPQTYQPHPHGMASPMHAQTLKQHRTPSIAQPPTPTSSHPSTDPHEYQQLPPSPLTYFAPIPSGMAAAASAPMAMHHSYSANSETAGYFPAPTGPRPFVHADPQQQYYPVPAPAQQSRRSSMPSFRPPPPSASQLGLFKSRAPVEMVREEEHHPETRRLSAYEGTGGWEELSYSGRR